MKIKKHEVQSYGLYLNKMNEKKKHIFKSLNSKLLLAVFIAVLVFFGCQIYITSVIGTSNAAIEEIRIDKDELRLQNEILSSEIDELKSTKNLEEIATRYNLVEKDVIEIEIVDNSIAIGY